VKSSRWSRWTWRPAPARGQLDHHAHRAEHNFVGRLLLVGGQRGVEGIDRRFQLAHGLKSTALSRAQRVCLEASRPYSSLSSDAAFNPERAEDHRRVVTSLERLCAGYARRGEHLFRRKIAVMSDHERFVT